MSEQRFQLATVIAPCTPAVLIFIGGFQTQSFQWNFLIVGLALVTGYLGFFVVGFPLVYLLRRAGLLSLPILMLSGAVFGVFVFYLFWLFLNFLLGSSAPFELAASFWGALLGLSVAFSFGLIGGITNIAFKRDAAKARRPLTLR